MRVLAVVLAVLTLGAPTAAVAQDGPTEAGVVTGPSAPEAGTGRPVFQLPFRWDETWQAGAPHEAGNVALDFGPRRVGGNDDVVAAAPGLVQRVTCSGGSYPQVDHGNGWVSRYYHVVNVNWSLVGHHVVAGTRLGDAGQATPCGGRSTFPHVHFTVLHHGQAVSADGISMGGYTVHSTGQPYYGYWTRDGDGARVVTAPGEAKCCLRSTTRAFVVPDQGVLADVDGDGRDDVVLRRGTTISMPDLDRRFTWGRNTDGLHLGDVTGDGRADFVFRRGAEYFVNHDLFQPGGDARPDRRFTWGRATDQFFLADVDGDGRDDFVLRHGSTVAISTDSVAAGGDANTDESFDLGRPTDRLVLGDVTGDGRADFVLQRGNTYLVGDRQFTWGPVGGRLHLGDVDGDGRDDFVLRRGTTVSISTDSAVDGGDPNTERRFDWGRPTDQLHLGDVTGDGAADFVLRRGRNVVVRGVRSYVAGVAGDQFVVQPTTTA